MPSAERAVPLDNLPHAAKETYGCVCRACNKLWDCFQVPCPIEVSILAMNANRTCPFCSSPDVGLIMPSHYEEMKAEARARTETERNQDRD
jgi:hypothetical protein